MSGAVAEERAWDWAEEPAGQQAPGVPGVRGWRRPAAPASHAEHDCFAMYHPLPRLPALPPEAAGAGADLARKEPACQVPRAWVLPRVPGPGFPPRAGQSVLEACQITPKEVPFTGEVH